LAITAAMEIARWALNTGDMTTFEIAVTAGLRVFPGHEELLALQEQARRLCFKAGLHS
jgi:hypothetical protein